MLNGASEVAVLNVWECVKLNLTPPTPHPRPSCLISDGILINNKEFSLHLSYRGTKMTRSEGTFTTKGGFISREACLVSESSSWVTGVSALFVEREVPPCLCLTPPTPLPNTPPRL